MLCPKKGVWNFQALKTPAFIEIGEFQTPFFGQAGKKGTYATPIESRRI
jgi:hypothetical protein